MVLPVLFSRTQSSFALPFEPFLLTSSFGSKEPIVKVAFTFTLIHTLLKDIKGKELLTNIKKTITVEEFKFTDKVNTFMVCQIPNCKKKMPYAVDCKVITCASCGTCQKVKACEKGMSAHLCAQIDGKDVWLTAFTDFMKMLINKVDLSCNNTTDELKEGLLNLENVKLLIDSTSNFILDVLEYTRPHYLKLLLQQS